jgi:HAD superfamily hydrolase (TIGR01549 family)
MIYNTDNKPNFKQYDLILVDLYNTLVRNTIRKHPYKVIFDTYKDEINIESRKLFDGCMTSKLFIKDFLKKEFGIIVTKEEEVVFQSLLQEEFDSLVLNNSLIKDIRNSGAKIVLISNLSPEYYKPVKEVNKQIKLDKEILSFSVGELKPNLSIFNNALNSYPNSKNILMIGDNYKLDIEPTIQLNIDAYHVEKWW